MGRDRDTELLFGLIWGIILFVVCLGSYGGGRVLRFWIVISIVWSACWFYGNLENQVAVIGLIVWWFLYWIIDPD